MKARFWILAALAALPSAPAAAQKPLDQPGTVSHRRAEAHFVERVGEFRRTSVVQYDEDGHDISASYELVRGDGRLVLTVYVYPATEAAETARPTLCNQEFNNVRQVIGQQYGGATMTEEGPAPAMTGIEAGLSHRSVYRLRAPFAGEVRDLRSEVDLYCYVGRRWLVKYRATSNEGFDAGPEVERFIRTGPWPGRPEVVDPDDVAALLPAATRAP
jgi:hypothetical protein